MIRLGHGEDYQFQLAVGQCPKSCIHYITPSQRFILEELLDRYIVISLTFRKSLLTVVGAKIDTNELYRITAL